MSRKTPWEKEWGNLQKKEARYKKKRSDGPTSMLLMKLDRFIPAKLSATFASAFFKAFQMIFEKGTTIIEHTYSRKKKQNDFMVNEFTHEMYRDRKSLNSFTRQARGSRLVNLLISFVEGVGLGIVGMGIPDIPLFMAVVLKSVYEVSLSYGYDYHDDNEKIFILKIIEVAMTDDEEFLEGDRQMNEAIDVIASDGGEIGGWSISKEDQMRQTSDSLVHEMLYTKFLQGKFIIGIIGGVFDPVYVNRITNYAILKYRRRFLAIGMEREGIERKQ